MRQKLTSLHWEIQCYITQHIIKRHSSHHIPLFTPCFSPQVFSWVAAAEIPSVSVRHSSSKSTTLTSSSTSSMTCCPSLNKETWSNKNKHKGPTPITGSSFTQSLTHTLFPSFFLTYLMISLILHYISHCKEHNGIGGITVDR